MSLSISLTESVDKVIETFIERVSKEYNLDKDELQSLWGGKTQNTSIKKDITNSNKMEVNHDNLLNYNKQELIALCKSKGKKCSGTKVILINRLLGKEDEQEKKFNKRNDGEDVASGMIIASDYDLKKLKGFVKHLEENKGDLYV